MTRKEKLRLATRLLEIARPIAALLADEYTETGLPQRRRVPVQRTAREFSDNLRRQGLRVVGGSAA